MVNIALGTNGRNPILTQVMGVPFRLMIKPGRPGITKSEGLGQKLDGSRGMMAPGATT